MGKFRFEGALDAFDSTSLSRMSTIDWLIVERYDGDQADEPESNERQRTKEREDDGMEMEPRW